MIYVAYYYIAIIITLENVHGQFLQNIYNYVYMHIARCSHNMQAGPEGKVFTLASL